MYNRCLSSRKLSVVMISRYEAHKSRRFDKIGAGCRRQNPASKVTANGSHDDHSQKSRRLSVEGNVSNYTSAEDEFSYSLTKRDVYILSAGSSLMAVLYITYNDCLQLEERCAESPSPQRYCGTICILYILKTRSFHKSGQRR